MDVQPIAKTCFSVADARNYSGQISSLHENALFITKNGKFMIQKKTKRHIAHKVLLLPHRNFWTTPLAIGGPPGGPIFSLILGISVLSGAG